MIETRPRRTLRQGVVDVAVLTAAVGLALLPLLPVYGDVAVARPVVGGLVLGATIAAVGAWRAWHAVVVVAVAVLGYLLAGGALAAPTTTIAGVLPTGRTLELLLTGSVTVWKQVLTLDPALGESGNLLAAPYLLALVGTVAAVSAGLRAAPPARAVWAALVPVAVLGLAVLLGTKVSVQAIPAGLATVLLLLPWAAWRRRTLAPRVGAWVALVAVLVGAGAVGGPVLVADRDRFVLRDEIVPPFDPRDQVSPLSGFRVFVKDWVETDLLTVRGLPEGARVRLATMDAFDGVVWNVAGSRAAEGSGQFRRVGGSITPTERGEVVELELEVHHLPGVWLPTVGYAETFDFAGPDALDLADQLRYNDATGGAVLTDGVADGTTWSVTTVVPAAVDPEDLGATPAADVRLPEPTGVPEAVPLFAGELAGSATTPALIATALESGLSGRGWFSHGLTDIGDYPSQSGHGADRTTRLLTADLMVGDSEQYASAMALMARQMGLPARVVLGLVPDETQDGAAEITFTGADIEAWVEIAFDGYGWVTFSPTPDEAKTPQDDSVTEEADPQPQVHQPPPPPAEPVTPPKDETEVPQTEDTEQDLQRDATLRTVLTVVAAGGVPLLLVGGPLLLVAAAKRRRRRRRRTAARPVDRVVGGWEELLDHARDMRRPPPSHATRRETAVHLAGAFVPADGRRLGRRGAKATDPAMRGLGRRSRSVGGPVAGLAAGADAIVFGPGEPSVEQVEAYWAQVDVAVAAMREMLPRRGRWRARWSTASLRAAGRARRAAGRGAGRGPGGSPGV